MQPYGQEGKEEGNFFCPPSPLLRLLGTLGSWPAFPSHFPPMPLSLCSNVSVGQSEGGIEWKAPLGTDIFLGSGGGGGGRRGRLGKVPPRLPPPPNSDVGRNLFLVLLSIGACNNPVSFSPFASSSVLARIGFGGGGGGGPPWPLLSSVPCDVRESAGRTPSPTAF